jgi:dTDP-L-rhamnose 4-epimerase
MRRQILITGGAGFIGSHLADKLLEQGHAVRVLDVLAPQVHGKERRRPSYLDGRVELVVGDVNDRQAVSTALDGVDAVYHFAAMVGVGQSMYRMADYAATNSLGTAVLLEALVERKVHRLVVASSMSIYGEGLFRRSNGVGGVTVADGRSRSIEQLRRGAWEVVDDSGAVLVPLPTPETKPAAIESTYALTKYDQERMSILVGRAYGVPTVALRFFNVYGPRQALSNPYTGVLAIFASRLLNDRAPLVFEDGLQRRDFVSVHDVVQACVLALDAEDAVGRAINIGSGKPRTILDVARAMAAAMGKSHIEPELPGTHRVGDVRHCFADIALATRVLGYAPKVQFEDGLHELVGWLEGQMPKDRVAEARAELGARGLTL